MPVPPKKRLSFPKFVRDVERISTYIIESCHANRKRNEWDENHITFNLSTELHRVTSNRIEIHAAEEESVFTFFGTSCLELCSPIRQASVEWVTFKQVGAAEKDTGDLAIVVSLRRIPCPVKSRVEVHGVAYLECKKRPLKSSQFRTLRWDQLEHIVSQTKSTWVLFYDWEEFLFSDSANGLFSRTHAVCVRSELVTQIRKKERWIQCFGTPFSMQLLRFLLGMDPDYLKKSRADIHRLLAEMRPEFVLAAFVGIDTEAPPGPEPDFLGPRYRPLE